MADPFDERNLRVTKTAYKMRATTGVLSMKESPKREKKNALKALSVPHGLQNFNCFVFFMIIGVNSTGYT